MTRKLAGIVLLLAATGIGFMAIGGRAPVYAQAPRALGPVSDQAGPVVLTDHRARHHTATQSPDPTPPPARTPVVLNLAPTPTTNPAVSPSAPPPPPAPPTAAASPTPVTLPDVVVTPSALPEPTSVPATPGPTAKPLAVSARSDGVFPIVAGALITLGLIAAGSIALLVLLR
jgi:hypothetical protein